MPINLSFPEVKPKDDGPVARKVRLKASVKESKRRFRSRVATDLAAAKRHYLEMQASVDKSRDAVNVASAVAQNKRTIISEEQILLSPPAISKRLVEKEIVFQPNPGPQTEFLSASEREVFYGGARGGGKSYSLIVDPLRYCDKENARALILRRTMPELRDLINHSQRLYPKAFPDARTKWREQEKEWRFPSGARIEFGYAETRQDALRYQGQSYTWIGVDELPQFPTPEVWNDLRGSLRSVDPSIPEYMRATGNPGNIGSNWVKETFIDPAPYNTRFKVPILLPDGTYSYITRRFIPAKLKDNPHLTRTNSYMTALASLPEVQKKQWLEGNWDVWEGAAFPEFRREVHTCSPFELPKVWPKFRACDWGYSSPAVCLWFAVDYEGTLWVYRELKVQGMPPDVFARKILALEQGERVQYGMLDSSVWSKRGDIGPSIVETMQKEGLRWKPSDRSAGSRHSGKIEVHRRLALNDISKKPSLVIFSNCDFLIKELPILPLDDNDPEDVDTKANDHSYDALRYGCMSRPISPTRLDWLEYQTKTEQYQPVDKLFGY